MWAIKLTTDNGQAYYSEMGLCANDDHPVTYWTDKGAAEHAARELVESSALQWLCGPSFKATVELH